ncbi:MAG: hypothetical protein AAFR79_05070 [Pseudomonadota bacterium]
MYRVKLERTADGGGLVLSARDAARLCLTEGDELVVAEVIHRPAYLPEGAEDPPRAQRHRPAPASDPAPPLELGPPLEPPPQVAPDGTARRIPPAPPPEAEPMPQRETPNQTEIDKSAFRKLAR